MTKRSLYLYAFSYLIGIYLPKVDQKVSYRRQIARQHSWSIRFHHIFAHHPSVVDSLGLG